MRIDMTIHGYDDVGPHSQTCRPITLGILHMRGAQTTKATNMLYNLSVAGCVEHKTLTLSLPAEFKCVGKEKHETEIMRLKIEWR
jgi:hypothetical protein